MDVKAYLNLQPGRATRAVLAQSMSYKTGVSSQTATMKGTPTFFFFFLFNFLDGGRGLMGGYIDGRGARPWVFHCLWVASLASGRVRRGTGGHGRPSRRRGAPEG